MLLLEDGPTRWLFLWTYVIFRNENNIAYFGLRFHPQKLLHPYQTQFQQRMKS